jgi:hypothetical protein
MAAQEPWPVHLQLLPWTLSPTPKRHVRSKGVKAGKAILCIHTGARASAHPALAPGNNRRTHPSPRPDSASSQSALTASPRT